MAIKVFVLLAMVVAPSLAAQTDSSTRDPHLVQPERPTVATHAYTVARGWLELEEGGEWDKASDGTRSFFAPTNLKIGLASAMQFNVMFNVIGDRAIRNGNPTLSDVSLGVKYRILEGDRILADFAILPAVKLQRSVGRSARVLWLPGDERASW